MIDYKNDFYNTINQDWLASKQLIDTQTHVDSFSELTDRISDFLYCETNHWVEKGRVPKDYGLENFTIFYRQASDFKKRELLGVRPLIPVLNRYKSMESFEEYILQLSELELLGQPNLLPFHIAPDFLDSRKNMIWAEAPGLTFPDMSYYESDSEQGRYLLDTWQNCQRELLEEVGFSREESDDILIKVIELDRLLGQHISQKDESLTEEYIVYDFNDFCQLAPGLPLNRFFKDVIADIPNKIIVSEEKFWKECARIFYSKEMWKHIKAKLIYSVVTMYAPCLTNKVDLLSSKFRCMLMGIDNSEDKKQSAYELTQFALGNSLSYWYSEQILSQKDKKNIEKLVDMIIQEYKNQIAKCLELTLTTRKKIINKLENIVVQIGGPKTRPERIDNLLLEDTLVDNVNTILANSARSSWNKWMDEAKRYNWDINSFTVDAYYHAQMNKIILPAGILQKPFYSKEYSCVKNLSRLGFLVAHEISHAFDIDGIRFDEYGRYENLLSHDDEAYFQCFSKKIEAKYDGQQLDECVVNGTLTLSENIADIAGFNCLEEIISNYYPLRLEEFYREFAKLWRIIYRHEYLEMMTLTDSHTPNKLRVNNLLSNSKKFTKLYHISKGDGMWVGSENQIVIW
ncbi:M13 family metallopeptidase [Streptococcus dysgalactiae]|uniref:M13 family metallopeptidase n=1 Tax=Streptococcus dysgalactiae TaxID=1334 RepID=UPI003FD83B32